MLSKIDRLKFSFYPIKFVKQPAIQHKFVLLMMDPSKKMDSCQANLHIQGLVY